MSVTIELYLKVVHHNATWSKKLLRNWVKISAAAVAWISSIVYDMALVYCTSNMMNGICDFYSFWSSPTAALAHGIWHVAFFFFVELFIFLFEIFIFVFCYGRILVVIRCQARVMASHSELDQVPLVRTSHDQDDDHRKCSLHHYTGADLRLLYATAHHAEPHNVHARLLSDFWHFSTFPQTRSSMPISLIQSGASWCV